MKRQTTSDELELAEVCKMLNTTVFTLGVVASNADGLRRGLELHRQVPGEDLERLLLSLGILRVGLEELEATLSGLRSVKKEC